MKRKRDLSDFAPPGARLSRMLVLYFAVLGIAMLVSALSLVRMEEAYSNVLDYDHQSQSWHVDPNAEMEDFAPLVMPCFSGFLGVSLLCVAGIFVNRTAFYRGSKSIYLMKRLPTGGELFRRTAVLPLLGLLLTLAVFSALVCLYYFIYLRVTPEECLAPDQLARLFEYLFDPAAYAARIRSEL